MHWCYNIRWLGSLTPMDLQITEYVNQMNTFIKDKITNQTFIERICDPYSLKLMLETVFGQPIPINEYANDSVSERRNAF